MFARLKHWAQAIKRDIHAIYLASRDPRVPWYAKLAAMSVATYALSPIDLIPDFIPIIGYLDELVILPVALAAVVKLIPPAILAEHRATAAGTTMRSRSIAGAVAIVLVWLAAVAAVGWLIWRYAVQPHSST